MGTGEGLACFLRRPAASRLVETSPARPSTMATGSVSASPKNRNPPAAPTAPNVRAYASSQREDLAMKVCIGVFAAIVLTMALASMSFAQTAPAQPQDPTAQSPASPAPASPASPSAKRPPDEGQKPSEGESSAPAPDTKIRPFMGTVVHENGGYFLRAGDLKYKLDDQSEARRYEGRSVKVTGSLEKQSNTIHVQKIEASPSS